MKKEIEAIAYINNGYNEKFGIPRQSGLAPSVISKIIFENKYSDINMLRGIEQYSYLYLIWGFSENDGEWTPTVRPPRLGGNKRVGVFATRSPFRPNSLGLSIVKLLNVKRDEDVSYLVVSGADLKDGTPIYDIKPYIPYVDSIPSAEGGFSENTKDYKLNVEFSCENSILSPQDKEEIIEILSLDPRPAYQNDGERVYGLSYKDYNIKFICNGEIVFVTGIEEF